jgi:hypothetical protein
MPRHDQSERPPETQDAVLLLIRSLGERVANLEGKAPGSLTKTLTTSASTSALFLGLVLTFVSLYDAFVTKPEADRISRISNFDQAVNSAARIQQEMVQTQAQTPNPKVQLAINSLALPQILTDLSTAKAQLKYLSNKDVEIPQLIILITGAFTTGDMASARNFVDRAIDKKDATPYLQSEAKWYQGQLLFRVGNPDQGRQSYEDALLKLGSTPMVAAQRAYFLGDLVLNESAMGDCRFAATELTRFAGAVHAAGVSPKSRSQLVATVEDGLAQLAGQHCPTPRDLETLFGT